SKRNTSLLGVADSQKPNPILGRVGSLGFVVFTRRGLGPVIDGSSLLSLISCPYVPCFPGFGGRNGRIVRGQYPLRPITLTHSGGLCPQSVDTPSSSRILNPA